VFEHIECLHFRNNHTIRDFYNAINIDEKKYLQLEVAEPPNSDDCPDISHLDISRPRRKFQGLLLHTAETLLSLYPDQIAAQSLPANMHMREEDIDDRSVSPPPPPPPDSFGEKRRGMTSTRKPPQQQLQSTIESIPATTPCHNHSHVKEAVKLLFNEFEISTASAEKSAELMPVQSDSAPTSHVAFRSKPPSHLPPRHPPASIPSSTLSHGHPYFAGTVAKEQSTSHTFASPAPDEPCKGDGDMDTHTAETTTIENTSHSPAPRPPPAPTQSLSPIHPRPALFSSEVSMDRPGLSQRGKRDHGKPGSDASAKTTSKQMDRAVPTNMDSETAYDITVSKITEVDRRSRAGSSDGGSMLTGYISDNIEIWSDSNASARHNSDDENDGMSDDNTHQGLVDEINRVISNARSLLTSNS
jgi:hypothetical protein